MSREKTPKYSKGFDAKKKIFEASIKLINEKGYDATTIKDICKAADIGTGTFYHYFKSKQDIVIEYVKNESQDIIDFYSSLPKQSYYDSLLSIIEYQLDYIDLKGREFVKNVFAIELLNNITLLGIDKYSAYNLVYECLSKGQENKEFSAVHDVKFMTDIIVYSIIGFIHNWIKYTDKSIKDTCFLDLKQLIEMFR